MLSKKISKLNNIMHIVHIKASKKQLSKLRNGHKVRISPAIEGQGFNLIIDPGSANITVSGLNQISSSKIRYGSANYTESTTAVMTNINRVLTAPLLIKLENLS